MGGGWESNHQISKPRINKWLSINDLAQVEELPIARATHIQAMTQ